MALLLIVIFLLLALAIIAVVWTPVGPYTGIVGFILAVAIFWGSWLGLDALNIGAPHYFQGAPLGPAEHVGHKAPAFSCVVNGTQLTFIHNQADCDAAKALAGKQVSAPPQAATQAPVNNAATPAAVNTEPASNVVPLSCRPMNDYPTQGLPELASSGQWILVEMQSSTGIETEAILKTADAPGGRFLITNEFVGHAWEYGPGCTYDDVLAAAQTRHTLRVEGGVDNRGMAPADLVNRMFKPAA